MPRTTRPRLQTALLVILCLLFQQAAFAAYVCRVQQMPAPPVAMGEHCAAMGMAQMQLQMQTQAQDNPILCDKHCSPDRTVVTDSAKLSVPHQALPVVSFAPVLVQAMSRAALRADVPIARSDPPPRLRFCSLLI